MPAQQPDKITPFATGDLLAGANVIYDFLVEQGMPEGTSVYYLRQTGRWPIENTAGDGCGGGGILIASKYRLLKHLEKLMRGARRDGGRRPTKPRRNAKIPAPPNRRGRTEEALSG